MANRDWLDVDGNYNNTANWSGGAVPVANDVVRFLKGTMNINTNLNQVAVAPDDVIIGPQFAGIVGSPTNPLIYGATVDRIMYNGVNCQGCSIQASTVTDVIVINTHAQAYSFLLTGGTATNLYMKYGLGARVGAAATVVNIRQSVDRGIHEAGCQLTVDAGATLTNAWIDGGKFYCRDEVTAGVLTRGEWIQDGEDVDITALAIHGGLLNLLGQDCDVPTLEIFGGTLDASGDSSPKSIGATSLILWPRATLNVNNGARTIAIGTINQIGSPSIIIEPGRSVDIEAT